jgi:outer membrane autotransporter protein
MDQRSSATFRRLTTSLLLGTCLSPCPLWAADFTVTSNADSGAGSLRQAIINSNAAGGSNNIIINSGVGTITLTSGDLPTINNNATIVGNNNTLSGGNTFRGLFVGGFSGTTQTSVSVSVSDLTIANARARGGNGTQGGGGGAGLGGALFVAANATLTVSNVTLASNSAVGGNGGSSLSGGGGGGGMGGNGGTAVGGGGGLGVGSNGGNNVGAGVAGIASGGNAGGTGGTIGTAGGANGGGGGGGVTGSGAGGGVGGANGINGGGDGGAGGFGGGGGASRGAGTTGGAGGFGGGGGLGATGGAGGFGGGGGGVAGGAGGFAGGAGATGTINGGGGAGLGGAVFVQQGGTFNIAGAFNVTGSTATGGTAGGGTATAGSAFGAGIFLQGSGTVNFAPGAGVIQTMSNAIADQTGSGGTGGNAGSWMLAKFGAGTLVLQAANTYSGGTSVTGGLINFSAANNFGSGQVTLNGGGLQWATGNTADVSGQLASLGSSGATFDTNGNNVTFANPLGGTGGLTKAGIGTLTLSGANTYSGVTTIDAGTLQLASGASLASALTINAGTFAINGNTSIGNLSGSGGAINLASGILTVNSSANSTLASTISGAGGLTKAGNGTLSLTGANSYTGATTVSAGTLAVNGSITSNVTVGSGGTLGGTGTIVGNVVTTGNLAPGNSIGTLTVNGNYTQSAGSTYTVEVNAAGQTDKLNVTGTATINGGTVAVQAQSGSYARNTTYTILTANGGVSGTYSNLTSNFAFLTPSLSYDANNVYLSLVMNQSAFAAGALTPNQYAVGTALDQSWASATGDFSTVLNALSVLSTQQGPQALNQISGQPYADFGTVNVQGSTLFMNAVGQQLSAARGGVGGSGQRQALAQACDAEACDAATGPWGVWVSGLGGFGNVLGNGNSQTLTYNFIGTAAGIDYRVTPNVLLGVAAGYTYGQQWVDSFFGKGWSNTLNVTAYGSFTLDGFYADALAGYAYSNNQLQRQLFIPGLQGRTANGSAGANQFLGQLETGYRIGVFALTATTVTPFARLQLASVNQAAFQEWGASSLSLNVAQQTTNSVRTTFGADLAASFGLGNQRTLDMGVRVGWLHEYADTGRPMTAAFAGAPANGFTVYGATPQRDSAVIGLRASSYVADATQLYFRYDGELGGGSDNHVFNVGVRLSW